MKTETLLLSQVASTMKSLATCFPAVEPGYCNEILHHRYENKKAKEAGRNLHWLYKHCAW